MYCCQITEIISQIWETIFSISNSMTSCKMHGELYPTMLLTITEVIKCVLSFLRINEDTCKYCTTDILMLRKDFVEMLYCVYDIT